MSHIYEFGPFRLDAAERRLLRDGHPIPLRGKVFDTLCALVERRGRLVEKQELFSAVWPDALVEEGNLTHNISVLRKALGGQVTADRYIETVPGHGYRFVAEVVEIQRRDSSPCPGPWRPAPKLPLLVQRQHELGTLHECWQRALAGARQMVFVTGEAGIGKTTLIEAFTGQVLGQVPMWFGTGQCVESRGEGEAYRPVLEALGRMCRGPSGPELITFLARCAPTWLVQMPWLLSDAEVEALQPRVIGATRDRMLREFVEATETLTAGKPLLLVLEDLHWSDYSTRELLAGLARRGEPARLLVIGTCRSGELRAGTPHPSALLEDLKVRGLCHELPLALLRVEAVEECLASRLPGHRVRPGMARLLCERTDGNPLFVFQVVDHWVSQGLLEKPLTELSQAVPDTLRQLIERQLETADWEERAILEAASVAGREFSTAAVADAVERPETDVESGCHALAERGQLLNFCGAVEWPDGAVSARYAFLHDLHREVLYARLPPGRKARLHRRIGAWLERTSGSHARERAAELAVHFSQGRDPRRAARYLQYAGEQAMARSAHREAVEHFTAALRQLLTLPESPDRTRHEIGLHAALAPALIATRGWAAPEAKHAYLRAAELSRRLDYHRPEVLVGLATLLEVGGHYRQSQSLMEDNLRRAPTDLPAELQVESHVLLACSLFHQGVFGQSLEHANRARTLYEPACRHTFLASLGGNPAVEGAAWAALSSWFLGYPERALDLARTALAVAQDHSYSVASAQNQAAILRQYRREAQQVLACAEAAEAVAKQHDFPYRVAVATILRGWALAMLGQCSTGITLLRDGIDACRSVGAELDRPYYLALLAESYAAAGQPEDALYALAEALELVRGSRTFFYEAELHRLWGEVLSQAGSRRVDEIGKALEQAVEVARRQQARCLELRAAVSLVRFRRHHGDGERACELLAGVYGGFTEGFDTPDLCEARRWLEMLPSAACEPQLHYVTSQA